MTLDFTNCKTPEDVKKVMADPKNRKLIKSALAFQKSTENIAKKYGAKVSIGFTSLEGSKEITLADFRKDKNDK